MQGIAERVAALEDRFWQAIVDKDVETATSLLHEPALMVSAHGAMKFDHAGYRRMVEQGSMELCAFRLSDIEVVCPDDRTAVMTYSATQTLRTRGQPGEQRQQMKDSSTWVKADNGWKCVVHTETPAADDGG